MSWDSDPGLAERSTQDAVRQDSYLDLLSDHRRRTILRILVGMDNEEIGLSELVTEIETRVDGEHTIERDPVILDLHHRHLPKMADRGIVDYDHREKTVEYQSPEELEALLHCVAGA